MGMIFEVGAWKTITTLVGILLGLTVILVIYTIVRACKVHNTIQNLMQLGKKQREPQTSGTIDGRAEKTYLVQKVTVL